MTLDDPLDRLHVTPSIFYRVGACVILYTLGFTDVQIQHLLRWKSLAFMEYLRNLSTTVIRQSQVTRTFL